MNRHQELTLIAVLFLGAAATAIARQTPDALKQRVLTQAQSVSPDDYAFTRTVRTEQTSGGKTEQKVSMERFDPTKPAEARWSLVSVDGAAPSADALKDFRAEVAKRRGVPGYHRLAGYFGSQATGSADSRGRTMFHFTALPKDTVRVMDSDVSQNATVDASVSEANGAPFVEQVRITLRPTLIKLLFKLDRFEQTARYRIGPEGKPLLMEQTSDMFGSGMGKEGQVHTVIAYSDYRAVSKQR